MRRTWIGLFGAAMIASSLAGAKYIGDRVSPKTENQIAPAPPADDEPIEADRPNNPSPPPNY